MQRRWLLPSIPISIHALREEGDGFFYCHYSVTSYFYPRPPRGGRLLMRELAIRIKDISIHALREEGDIQRQYVYQEFRDFYPRPPRGGRRKRKDWSTRMELISIHALREEGDLFFFQNQLLIYLFLSTPSARRATFLVSPCATVISISIHALREEDDVFSKN